MHLVIKYKVLIFIFSLYRIIKVTNDKHFESTLEEKHSKKMFINLIIEVHFNVSKSALKSEFMGKNKGI